MNTVLSCNIDQSLSTHYLIYKIINNINGKYYIGQHVTDNVFDNYKGSGKLINAAEQKYGLSTFTKIILYDFDNFEEMNNKEIELVQLSNCFPYDPMSYNIKLGGNSGPLTPEIKQKCVEKCKQTWKNKTPDEKQQFKEKMSKVTSGKNNGMFGYKWSDEQRKHQSEVMKRKQNWFNTASEAKKQIFIQKLSRRQQGKNNSMYGKNAEDYMTPEAIVAKRKKMYDKQINTKRMQNLAISPKVVSVKYEDVEKYLQMGYTFFKFKMPKKT